MKGKRERGRGEGGRKGRRERGRANSGSQIEAYGGEGVLAGS